MASHILTPTVCAYIENPEDKIVLELKSVEHILPVHEAQVITYLRLLGKQVGLLINFNVPLLKKGIRRYALDAREIALGEIPNWAKP